MEFKRILQYLLMTLMPVYLVTGCGDLEPEMQDTMQDTRTVILKMDFDQRSSSRTSSVAPTVLSLYKTHLILALPSGDDLTIHEEFLSNNYNDFDTSFAKGLMNTETKSVSLDIPQDKLNKQMKIFAFLFQDNYTLPQLDDYSGTRTVGYYGKSQSFEIGTQTNLGLNICLIQVSTPTVSSVDPAENQIVVPTFANISVTFSKAMNPTSVTTNISNTTCSGSFQLSSNNFSSCIQMSSSPSSSNPYTKFTVSPLNNLSEGTNYKIRVTTGVKDTAGNSLSCQYETSNGFTTIEY